MSIGLWADAYSESHREWADAHTNGKRADPDADSVRIGTNANTESDPDGIRAYSNADSSSTACSMLSVAVVHDHNMWPAALSAHLV